MLSDDVVTRLRPHLEPVELQQGEHLFQSDQQLRHVFFFEGGLSSEIAWKAFRVFQRSLVSTAHRISPSCNVADPP